MNRNYVAYLFMYNSLTFSSIKSSAHLPILDEERRLEKSFLEKSFLHISLNSCFNKSSQYTFSNFRAFGYVVCIHAY